MRVFEGNCYEEKPNRKWMELNKKYVEDFNKPIESSFFEREVVYAENVPSFSDIVINPDEGQEVEQTENDGRIITGVVRGGVISEGTIKYKNKDQYEGEIWRSTAHGSGKMKYSNGEEYTGRFYKDRREGVGELITSNGKYNGSFKNNLYDGQGVFQFNDGSIYRGILVIFNSKLLNKK
jgi:hypothetical protein